MAAHRPPLTPPADFLAGGGEMAQLIASRDWSTTPLGPLSSWPQSLRTAVSLCLAAGAPVSLIWGPACTQIYNDRYRPLCGAKHEEAFGRDFRECWAPLWPVVGDIFARALRGETLSVENFRLFLDRHGFLEEAFFTFSFSPIRDETGSIGGLFHPVVETTAGVLSERRNRTLRQLSTRAGQAHSVPEAAAEATAALAENQADVPFSLLYLQDESGRELRLLAGSMEPPGDAFPLRQVLESGQPQIIENPVQLLGLTTCGPYPELPSKALILPIPRRAGVLVAGISARLPLDEAYRSFYDALVEHLAAALALVKEHHRSAAALSATERRLAHALAASELGVWELDLVTHSAWRSPQHDHIFGYPSLLPEWTYEMFLEHVVLEDRPAVNRSFRSAVAHGASWGLECRIRRADGVQRWIWAQGKVETGPDGQPRTIKGLVRDITDRKAREDELSRSNAELARTNRELEEFAYVASHDLQEPLRMVSVFSQHLVQRFVADRPEAQQYAGFIREGVHRMESLIRDLLHFSRTVHSDGLPPGGSVSLSDSLEKALSAVSASVREAGATITAGPLPHVYGDEGQLSQVFLNLLSNSFKYRDPSRAPLVHISARPGPDGWTISVQDNGIGFDPRYAHRIFGLFKRLHKDDYPGTGIGLAICKRIVERYGGRMWAESIPGQGSTFYFTLPPAEQP